MHGRSPLACAAAAQASGRAATRARLGGGLLWREGDLRAECDDDTDGDDREPRPARRVRVREAERRVERPATVPEERDREARGRERQGALPADLAAAGPETLRHAGLDPDDDPVPREVSGP